MNKFSIIVPADWHGVVRNASEELTRLFGGCTVQQATGWWHSDKRDRNIVEPVTVVWAIGDERKATAVQQLARRIARETEQECVLWTAEPIAAHFETGREDVPALEGV